MPIQIDRFESTVEIADSRRASQAAPPEPERDLRGAVRQILTDEIARHLRARGLRG